MRDRYKVDVGCADCGVALKTRHKATQYCPSCAHRRASAAANGARTAAAAERAEERLLRRFPVPLPGPPHPFAGRATHLPANHPARQDWTRSTGLTFVGGRCRRCGTTFLAATGNGIASYCGRSCQRMDTKDRRRAKAPGDIPPARRWFVFERDRWTCQLCGKLIQQRYRASTHHPQAPTIDHILPVDHGGDHQECNLQAAHRQCNSEKSNRTGPDGDQLRLAV